MPKEVIDLTNLPMPVKGGATDNPQGETHDPENAQSPLRALQLLLSRSLPMILK